MWVTTEYCSTCDCLGGLSSVGIVNPLVGNGICNEETNNNQCDYDGGDCCSNPNMVDNGFCNDETNIGACNYDGGDCCGSCVVTEYCLTCDCLGGLSTDEIVNPLIGNGICNEQTNNIECDHDGGDCCPNPNLVGNGFCNDQTNIAACNYDSGECCGPDVSCK